MPTGSDSAWVAVVFLNVFGAALAIQRKFFLKDTGRKLSHLDKQFNVGPLGVPAPSDERSELRCPAISHPTIRRHATDISLRRRTHGTRNDGSETRTQQRIGRCTLHWP